MPEHQRRWKRIASSALIIGLGLPVAAMANPVLITSGSLNWVPGTSGDVFGQSATITVTSASADLSMNLFAENGRFDPAGCGEGPDCFPGTTIPFFARWDAMNISGTAVFNGTMYPLDGSAAAAAQVRNLFFNGFLVMPVDFTGGTLTAPFTFSSIFAYPANGLSSVDLAGGGRAFLTFGPSSSQPGALVLTGARYEFQPTPEPASLLLLGTGIAGTWATRRSRRPENSN